MTKAELKIEIQKALENVPENVLQDILNIVQNLNQKGSEIQITHALAKILKEDSELLSRLAK